MPKRMDDQPQLAVDHPRPLRTIARLICLSVLLTAILYLFLLQIEPGAPFRQGGHPPAREAFIENVIHQYNTGVLQAAEGGNLELHFAGSPAQLDRQANPLSTLYFNWNYLLYPHRAFVGKDDQIINNGQQMFAADDLPEDSWLRAHQVTRVLTMGLAPGRSVSAVITPVPGASDPK